MKVALICYLALLSSPLLSQSLSETNLSINRFLKTYVQNGLVNYSGIADNREDLDGLITEISSVSLDGLSPESEKAILLNAYNIFVIKQVIDHYPIGSPQEVGDFFTDKKFNFAGTLLSLNGLEKDVLFKKHPDPRLHFALVCAAIGCPKIRSKAYSDENLEQELDAQSQGTIRDAYHVGFDKTSNTINLSKIFEWYASDFGKNKTEVIDFLNQYSAEVFPLNATLTYTNYDWSLNEPQVVRVEKTKSNLQLFTPSALFNKGEFEVNAFNSIYSQQHIRDADGDLVPLGQTQNFFTSMIMVTTGLSKKSRFNVGLDLFISKARTVVGEKSAFDIFNNSEALFNKTLISYIAPRIKFVPLKSVPRLSIQSALWIPVSNSLESEGFVAHNRYTWFTQIFFDKSIGENFQVFLETSLLYRFTRISAQRYDFFRVPLSAFLSYFPTSKSTIFAFSQYSPRFETTNIMGQEEFGLSQSFTQIGIGGKYQITNDLGIEISYSDFAFSRSEGAGHTVNFGLRYIYR
jgi:hypothetical protein